jgi:integrase/recombinase XerD
LTRTGKRKLTRTNAVSVNSQQSIEELFNIYIFAKQAEGLAKNTITNKKYYFNTFNGYIQQHNISLAQDVTVNVIREMIHYLRHEYVQHKNNHCVKDEYKIKGVSISYVNSILRNMKAFYNFLVAENYLASNPFIKVKLIKETNEIEALTLEQMKLLLKQPNQRSYAGFRDYVMLFLLLDTGTNWGSSELKTEAD